MAKYLLSGKKYWNKAVAILSVTICFAVTGCAGRIDDAVMPGLIQEEDIISNNNASVVYENETEKDTKSGVKVEIPAQTESATAVVEKSDVAKSASGVTGKKDPSQETTQTQESSAVAPSENSSTEIPESSSEENTAEKSAVEIEIEPIENPEKNPISPIEVPKDPKESDNPSNPDNGDIQLPML